MKQEVRSPFSSSASTPPVTLGLLVLAVTAIGLITIFLLTNLFFDSYIIETLFDFYQIYIIHQLFLFTPYFIMMIFLYLLLYKFTGDILRKEKKRLNNVTYSISGVLLSLWIFGVIGAFCVYIITNILTFDPESPIMNTLFLLLTDVYYILLAPLVPVLVVFFRMAYEKTLSSQVNMVDMTKAKSVSSFASKSPIPFLLILLTFISCLLLPVLYIGSFLGYLLRSFLLAGNTEFFYHTIVYRLISIVFSIFSLLLYFGIGILTLNILKNESEKNLKYMMSNSLFLLYLGGLLGALSYLGINILMGIILSSYTNFVELFYNILIGALHSLREPLIPVLIVLVLIAHESLFSSQNNYEM